MSELAWNWLAAPYVACTIGLAAIAIVTALVRGDRVMRLGMLGAAISAMPWAICSAMSACTTDPEVATRLLRLGNAPVSFIGPNLMLVMFGVSGQLERNRWITRISGMFAVVMMGIGWGTSWVVPTVHRLSSGMYYISAGPLTALQISQLGIWLGIGLFIARRTSLGGDRRQITRLLLAILVCGAIAGGDLLLVYDIWGGYPMAWVPCLLACGVGLYLVLRTDLLRPQGFDRRAFYEMIAFGAGAVVVAYLAVVVDGAAPLAYAVGGGLIWVAALAIAWGVGRRATVMAARGDDRIAQLADLDDEHTLVTDLAALWQAQAHVKLVAMWRIDGSQVDGNGTWTLAPDVAGWLSSYGEPLVSGDLATMRLGAMRGDLEAACRASLLVPMLDRGALVGVVEAELGGALREAERGLVAESARAAARALTYVGMAREAAREGETTREVEVAAAMREQASASRDDDFGRWAVGAEYRAAPKTTGAGWSVSLLADGRLALLVTEAQAHGLPAALASAALVGAFAAATSGTTELDELLHQLRASNEGVMRGREAVAAFIAILDHDNQRIDWACAGHPGAYVVNDIPYDVELAQGSLSGPRPTPIALGGGDAQAGASLAVATRGTTALPPDAMVLVASSGLRGDDEKKWARTLRDNITVGPKLAVQLVELAGARRVDEDLLAVVVRLRPLRSSITQML